MCVRIGIDLEISLTLSKATGPVVLEQLAAVKGASSLIAERVLRAQAEIEYVEEHDIHIYKATRMTHQMADRYSIAMMKFMLFSVQEGLLDNWNGGDDDVFLVNVAGGRRHDIKTFRHKFPNTREKFFDLFKPQPVKGASIYYLKFIFCNWSDAQCLEILQHIREAMKPSYSTLMIEEFILSDKHCPMLPAMWDGEMMLFLNSMERSEGHWRRLLTEAGFEPSFSYPPGDGQGIIRAELKE
ncbi:uncharacterized protein BDV17DRAFT_280274 [Aspergillus undulatus]|uniref:uncharacterized protein n=1 Tax=Aspergillus undulatus TaxID=1810928 RepID=UPI003CCDA80C